MVEKTFVIVKPDHVHMAPVILGELDNHGKRVSTAKVTGVPKEVVEAHYAPHKGKHFYESLITSFINKPVVIAVYEGEGVIKRFLDIIGPTDPAKAAKETIRGKFSDDSMDKATSEQRPVKNVVHRSDSMGEAEREINVWKQFLSDFVNED